MELERGMRFLLMLSNILLGILKRNYFLNILIALSFLSFVYVINLIKNKVLQK